MAEAAPAPADNGAEPPAPADNAPMTPAQSPAASEPHGNWLDSLPEDMRSNQSLTKFSTAEGLAKSYINLEKLVGSEKLPVPKGETDTEGWERVFKALGRPDDPDGYTFQKLDLPEGFAYNEDREKTFRAKAHELGLTVKQAQQVRDWALSEMAQDFGNIGADTEAAKLATIQELQNEWGNAFTQKLQESSGVVRNLFGDEFRTMLDETGLGNDPRLIKGFAKLAERVRGDKALIGEALTESTPGDLDAQISDFRAQHKEALSDKWHADHDRRQRELSALYAKRFPE